MPTVETLPETRGKLRFIFRGRHVEIVPTNPRRMLLDWLREDMRATGTKEGCNEGDCGACTVVLARARDGIVRYEPVNACILFLGQVDGAEVITIEDLARDGALHPVQEALRAHHGSQCGFCTPGIVMSLFALQQAATGPVTRRAIDDCLAGNLCRCTGYRPIADAAMEVCGGPADDSFARNSQQRLSALSALADPRDVFIGDGEVFFAAPASEATLAILHRAHPDATLLGGGTDVGLWVTKALADLKKIIWLGRVAGLDEIQQTGAALRLGATVSLETALPLLRALDPDLGEVMRRFGSRQVRASGTVGGNIANGSPIGDLAPCLIALGASVELAGGDSPRSLALEDFFIAYKHQDRRPGEYVRALVVPPPAAGHAFRAYKVSKRFDEDISAVMAAFLLHIDGRRIVSARVAFGGMAGTPARAHQTEAALVGLSLDAEEAWHRACEMLDRDFSPMSDQRASAAYRSTVARNLLFKALLDCAGMPEATLRLHPVRELQHAQ